MIDGGGALPGSSPAERAAVETSRALQDALQRAILIHVRRGGSSVQRTIQLPHPFSNMSREDWITSIRLWRDKGLPLLRQQPPRSCPSCGGDSAAPMFESYDGHPYVECDSCGAWYVPLCVNHELFERYFAICPEARRFGDYTLSQVTDVSVEHADDARFSAYYAELRTLLGPNARNTLDIGCGVANSFDAAMREGFEPYGIEVNKQALAVAARKGRRVSRDVSGLPLGEFDAVTFWESLEHMDDVQAGLDLAVRALKPDGALAITVPNLNSPSIRGMRADSMQIHGGPAWPGHINLFTPSALISLLERAGFQNVDVTGQYTMNLYELIGYHLGAWRGARDYIAKEVPTIALDAEICDLISAVAPAVGAWEQHSAMAPILRVTAHRKPSGALRKMRVEALESLWPDAAAAVNLTTPERRGRALDLHDIVEFAGPNVQVENERLEIQGAPEGQFTYAWASSPILLQAGSRVLMRGKLRCGGFSFGLLRDDAWADSKRHLNLGLVELSLGVVDEGAYRIVISNHLDPADTLDLTVDTVELIGGAETDPR